MNLMSKNKENHNFDIFYILCLLAILLVMSLSGQEWQARRYQDPELRKNVGQGRKQWLLGSSYHPALSVLMHLSSCAKRFCNYFLILLPAGVDSRLKKILKIAFMNEHAINTNRRIAQLITNTLFQVLLSSVLSIALPLLPCLPLFSKLPLPRSPIEKKKRYSFHSHINWSFSFFHHSNLCFSHFFEGKNK